MRPQWNPTIKLAVGILILLFLVAAMVRFHIVLIPIVVGAIIAYLLYPVVQRIKQNSRLPHGLATALLYLVIIGLLTVTVVIVAPLIGSALTYGQGELNNLARSLAELPPEQTVQILGFEITVQVLSDQISTALLDFVRSSATQPIELVVGVAETFLLAVFTALIGFYLTRDADQVIEWLHGLIPRGYQSDARQLMTEINRIWGAFFRGQFVLAILVGVIITILSAILGLPQPLLMGMLAAVLEFLPSVGHTIWIVIALIVALLEGSTTLPVSNVVFAALVAGVHLAFTQFDLNFLIPRIIGREIHLHPMVVILGLIVGASVGGVLGVALAAPTIATLRALGRYIYAMLFDLDPFPMVGPPSAPKADRLAELERIQQIETVAPPRRRSRSRKSADDDSES